MNICNLGSIKNHGLSSYDFLWRKVFFSGEFLAADGCRQVQTKVEKWFLVLGGIF